MRYVSTRRSDEASAGFEQVLLEGLARDGGLYVPEAWPDLDLGALSGADYPAIAKTVVAPFAAPDLEASELDAIAAESYADFDHPAVAPLVEVGHDLWVLELFHGPTLAFKDFALQMLARLFDRVLARRSRRVTIVGATSGDTGSAAIEACRGRENLAVVILHPKGRVSEIQRLQMTTVDAPNVHNVAIEGTFDNCQALVKAMFNDLAFRDEVDLAAVNSINWARVAAQIAYYAHAALSLDAAKRPVTFVVPTGNFGNVYAGYAAKRMGVPIERLVIATNRNDILPRFFETGEYRMEAVRQTLSPSMDIQVASNFERYLFALCAQKGDAVRGLMERLQADHAFALDDDQMRAARQEFAAARADDEACLATMADIYRSTGRQVDPHTATGLHAARALSGTTGPVVCLATAHPAKFPEAVKRATGIRPALPPRLADIASLPERVTVLPADFERVKAFVKDHAAGSAQDLVA